ncbi:MAG: hypothetical protein Q8M44_01300, partial [bacterium]|nr:hypothetical protein [bacterium]
MSEFKEIFSNSSKDISFHSSRHFFSFFVLDKSFISFNIQFSLNHQFASYLVILFSKTLTHSFMFLYKSNSLGHQKKAFVFVKMLI